MKCTLHGREHNGTIRLIGHYIIITFVCRREKTRIVQEFMQYYYLVLSRSLEINVRLLWHHIKTFNRKRLRAFSKWFQRTPHNVKVLFCYTEAFTHLFLWTLRIWIFPKPPKQIDRANVAIKKQLVSLLQV